MLKYARALIKFFRKQNPEMGFSRKELSDVEKAEVERDLFNRARSQFMDSAGWYEDNKHLFSGDKF